ncbi:hypothetical protein AX17_000204 [Amanita inopinata Kibby_2008]|nr:hypothetical protein AX17_000204 [Amanita inopinata Kibby_2008]
MTTSAASVLCLHGLGQSPELWQPMLTRTLASRFPGVRWILPQAPHHPVTFNQGQPRPSWFNIEELPPRSDESDVPTLDESVRIIRDLINAEQCAGVAPQQIFLMGFSQGAALALTVAFTSQLDLGGIIVLSGWVPHFIRPMFQHRNLPIMWCHGDADPEIPMEYAEEAMRFLTETSKVGSEMLDYKQYGGLDHSIDEREVADVEELLHKWIK